MAILLVLADIVVLVKNYSVILNARNSARVLNNIKFLFLYLVFRKAFCLAGFVDSSERLTS